MIVIIVGSSVGRARKNVFRLFIDFFILNHLTYCRYTLYCIVEGVLKMIYNVVFLLKDYPISISTEIFANSKKDIEFILTNKYKDNFETILNVEELNY